MTQERWVQSVSCALVEINDTPQNVAPAVESKTRAQLIIWLFLLDIIFNQWVSLMAF